MRLTLARMTDKTGQWSSHARQMPGMSLWAVDSTPTSLLVGGRGRVVLSDKPQEGALVPSVEGVDHRGM